MKLSNGDMFFSFLVMKRKIPFACKSITGVVFSIPKAKNLRLSKDVRSSYHTIKF